MIQCCLKIDTFKYKHVYNYFTMEENSLFINFMGDSPTVRVLDYLLTERDIDFSISDLARNAGIGRATLYRVFDGLVKNKIIVPTRIIGKAKLYKLNKENKVIQKLLEIDNTLVIEDLKQRSKKEKIAINA